jgi:uncharacterized membrane protein
MPQSVPVIESSLTTPRVRRITMDHPWAWLAAGWRDSWETPVGSLFYGAIFAAMGYFLTQMVKERFHLALALVTGFLLVGPFLAMGLYDLSRRLEKREPPTLIGSMLAWRNNPLALLLFGIVVGLLMIVWARLSALLFAVSFLSTTPVIEGTVADIFFSGEGLRFLIVFAVVGAIIAALVYTLSAVSVPMLLDRKTDFITAVLTSITAVRTNPGPMFLWGALIVTFTAVGLATFFVFYAGLAITVPLIGHATWHAYRDLVEPEKT